MRNNYQNLFGDWEIAIAIKLTMEFMASYNEFDDLEEDDLLQECLTHWLFAKDRYKHNRNASQKTFMATVIRNKLKDILEKLQTDKRRINSLSISIDQPLSDDEDSGTLLDIIPENPNYPTAVDATMDACLKRDLEKATSKLSSQQMKICSRLSQGYNIAEISKLLKTPRSTSLNRPASMFVYGIVYLGHDADCLRYGGYYSLIMGLVIIG